MRKILIFGLIAYAVVAYYAVQNIQEKYDKFLIEFTQENI